MPTSAKATARHALPLDGITVCNVSGFGATGPYADKKAYDLIVQSEVGMLSVTGTESTPCKVGVSIADISAGMYGYSGEPAIGAIPDVGQHSEAVLEELGFERTLIAQWKETGLF